MTGQLEGLCAQFSFHCTMILIGVKTNMGTLTLLLCTVVNILTIGVPLDLAV